MTLKAIIRKVNKTMRNQSGLAMLFELERLILKEEERMQKEESRLARKNAALKNKDL